MNDEIIALVAVWVREESWSITYPAYDNVLIKKEFVGSVERGLINPFVTVTVTIEPFTKVSDRNEEI